MKKIPVWFDCDTGVDDAIALILLSQLESFDVVGVSTVAGNVGVDKTTDNTLRVLDLCRVSYSVYRGAAQPMIREQITASYVHGEDGLGGVILPESERFPETLPAWDALYQAAVQHAGELVLIAVGPMTNIGLTLTKYKDFPNLIKRIVIMGGAAVGGNVTPAAEFNILADPEAAAMLFDCGVQVEMCGLDMTMKAYLTRDELDDLAQLGTPQATFARDCLQRALKFGESFQFPGVALHDPAAVLYADDGAMFEARPAWVRVETKGSCTYGKTVTDLYSDKKHDMREHLAVINVDRDAFKDRLFELFARFG
jgi:inosine-uridine nucleoside N-ribohydrolase